MKIIRKKDEINIRRHIACKYFEFTHKLCPYCTFEFCPENDCFGLVFSIYVLPFLFCMLMIQKNGNNGQAQPHMSSFTSEMKRVIKVHYIAISIEFTSMQTSIKKIQALEKNGAQVKFLCAILEIRAPSRRTGKIYVRRI